MLVKYRPTTSLLAPFLNETWSPVHEEEMTLSPRTDILEQKDSYVLYAEMPGIDKDQFKIELENRHLTIHGKKSIHEKVEGEKFMRVERQCGNYRRSFKLGEEIDTEKISASYDNGVLQVILPKSEKSKPKSVEIKVK